MTPPIVEHTELRVYAVAFREGGWTKLRDYPAHLVYSHDRLTQAEEVAMRLADCTCSVMMASTDTEEAHYAPCRKLVAVLNVGAV